MALCASTVSPLALACETPASVCSSSKSGSFPLIRSGQPASLFVDASADSAVRHVADSFAADLQRVGGQAPDSLDDVDRSGSGDLIIIGVLGHSAVIDGLVRAGKIAASDIAGQWEAYRQIVVDRPFPRRPRAGDRGSGSTRRGVRRYDLSEKIGVSPWYWFADVPVPRQATCSSLRDRVAISRRCVTAASSSTTRSRRSAAGRGSISAESMPRCTSTSSSCCCASRAIIFGRRCGAEGVQRRRPAEHGARGRDGSRDGHLASRADDARSRRVASAHGAGRHRRQVGLLDNAVNLRKFWQGGIERTMSKGGGQATRAWSRSACAATATRR